LISELKYLFAVALATALAVGFAPSAQAHVRTGVLATNYRATVHGSAPPGVVARIHTSDLALDLRAGPNHVVLVLGYIDEPFIRFDRAGTWVNERSPTAATVGLLRRTKRPAAGGWRHWSARRRAVWHDTRLRGPLDEGSRRAWAVPLEIDGRLFRLEGDVLRVRPPSVWLWLASGIPIAIFVCLLMIGGQVYRIRRAAVWSATFAGIAIVFNAVGFALGPHAPTSKWVLGANEIVVAVVGLLVIAFGKKEARVIAAGLVGLIAVFAGLTELAVFTHGIVFAAVPDSLARLGAACAIWAGATAIVTSAFFLDPSRARRLELTAGPPSSPRGGCRWAPRRERGGM
jgi:hypothetical protein